MKTVFILILLTLSIFSYSQDSTTVEQYCTVIATPRILSSKVTIDIDYGEERSGWKDYRVKDEEGKLKKFNSVIDGLNYLGKMGWKLVNAFPVSTSSGSMIYYYVFRKEFRKNEAEK